MIPILKYYAQRQLAGIVQYSELREPILAIVLIDSEEINAFAAPGGIVGINLGLMLHARDVHEYSSVVAHELAHLSQRHFARGIEEQRAQTLPMLAGLIAAIMIGAMGGGDAGMAAISGVQAASQASQLRYSRGREQEADRIGLNTLARANLDTWGMSRMFDRMDRAYRFTRRPPEFLLTHPLTETRIADARTQAMEYPRKQFPESLEYQAMRARARVRYAESPKSAVMSFEQQVEEQPDSQGARYGLAVALAAAERYDEAIPFVDQIHTDNPHNILFIGSLAELLTKSGRVDQAIGLLERELAVNPQNAALSALYADALVANRQYVAAERCCSSRVSSTRPMSMSGTTWPKCPGSPATSSACTSRAPSSSSCTAPTSAPSSTSSTPAGWPAAATSCSWRASISASATSATRCGSSAPETLSGGLAGPLEQIVAGYPSGLGKMQHPLQRDHRPAADFRIDEDFVRFQARRAAQHLGQHVQLVHRHPGAVGATAAGGAGAGGGRLDKALVGIALPELVEEAPVGGDDEQLVGQFTGRLDDLAGGPDRIGRPITAAGDSGCTSTPASG